MDSHRVLKCTMYNQFEFRCSYLLTQKKLSKFLADEKIPTEYQKSGFFDYDKIRFSDSRLKRHELIYCRNDVIGLSLGVRKHISDRGYDLRTTPLTATGFLRVDHRQKMRAVLHQTFFTQRHDDKEIIQYLHLAFRGGNTHANAKYIGDIIQDVHSYDIKSSYPSALYHGEFPLDKFKPVYGSIDLDNLNKRHAYLLYIKFTDIKLKELLEPIPYIPLSKCIEITKDYVLDNGRIRSCTSLSMWLTEIDYQIISDQYDYKAEVIKAYGAKKEPLPKVYRDYVYDTFKQKETLEKDTLEYRIFKAFLNALYGNCVMYPLKYNTVFEDGSFSSEMRDDYEKYIKKSVNLYKVGVWCTALARMSLHKCLRQIDKNDLLYCDTDSIKFTGNYDRIFTEYNQNINDALHLGHYEKDRPFKYDRFKTYGAKKYAYEVDGKIHITVAGVPKKGADELETLEDFTINKRFSKTGKKRLVYNDYSGKYSDRKHTVFLTRNIALVDTDYTLDITKDYQNLIIDLFKREVE